MRGGPAVAQGAQRMPQMRVRTHRANRRSGWLAALALCLPGCIQIVPYTQGRGTPFVISGTADIVDRDGPCRVWYGENGLTFHLVQGIRITDEEFARIVTPGTAANLELCVRSDVEFDCQYGTVVEVRRVLEILD